MSLFLEGVAASVAHFVAFEVLNSVDGMGRTFASGRQRSAVSVFGMEPVVDVAAEVFVPMEPGTGADEDASGKPLRSVIAIGSAIVGRDVIVAVGTLGRGSDFDADAYLSLGMRGGHGDNSHCEYSGQCKMFESHELFAFRSGRTASGP